MMRLNPLLTAAAAQIALIALLALLPAPAIARENHALLIGASSYPNLDERFWLVGPANDVDLVRSFLTRNETVRFEPANITVLADGVAGAADPTLANIRAQMAALTARVQRDDFVYLHFSGHGTQAPALIGETELDGLDELFLPMDIGLWDDSAGSVQNALVDDEIGQMVADLRATGATIWAVFDSCHSGTVTRAAPSDDDIRLRQLTPDTLGVPQQALDDAALGPVTRSVNPRAQDEPPVESAPSAAPALGDFIAFYAAQSNESTPEKRLPRGKPGRRSQGVFTYTIFETLASNPGISYRQLGQEVLRKYATQNRARSTPMFVGALDQPVFGLGQTGDIFQWPVTLGADGQASLPAGQLHKLSSGARLALLASPADPLSAAIGLAEISELDMFTAQIAPIADGDTPAIALADLPPLTYARRLDDSLDFALTVALPSAQTDPAARAALSSALDYARTAELLPPRITFAAAGAPADLRLAINTGENAVMVLPDTGLVAGDVTSRNPKIALAGKTDEDLAIALIDTLTRMAKVQNLLKLGGSATGQSLKVDVALQTRAPESPDLNALEAVPVPRMTPGDEVHILAQNQEDTPVDLNVVYIGSDYSITHMFKGRLHPGDTLKQGLLRITDDSFGRDQMIVFMTPAKAHTAVEDFGFLAQTDLPAMRAAGGSPFAQTLAEAGFGQTLRAAVPLGAAPDQEKRPSMLFFNFDTKPLE